MISRGLSISTARTARGELPLRPAIFQVSGGMDSQGACGMGGQRHYIFQSGSPFSGDRFRRRQRILGGIRARRANWQSGLWATLFERSEQRGYPQGGLTAT